MRRFAGFLTAVFLGFCGPAEAGDRAGDFDYYVLSLGWSASWCALTGDARGDAQCDAGRGLTFTLHGLWPQNETGYPQDCYSDQPDASKSQTAAMADLMGTSGLAWHEWKKHGRCSGLSAAAYFDDARKAYAAVTIPDLFAKVRQDLTLPAHVIEDAFLESNPALTADEISVTCDQGKIAEVRVCLTKDLSPRPCGADVARECTLPNADLPSVR
jgi:ribonuclease T2